MGLAYLGDRISFRGFWTPNVLLLFKKKTLTFRDSLCIIPAKLASFGSMFNLKVHKEVMAYKLYTKVNRDRRVIPIQEYYDQLDIENCHKSEEERANLKQQLLDNAMRVNRIYKCVCYDADNSTIDIMQYAKFYCLLDVKVLKEGMNQFEHDIAQVFTEYDMLFYGIHNYLSISSLGYSLAKTYGCFDECFELSGKPQHFISRAVNGGRTMTAENKKQLVTDSKIQDFDAVSLYPSAMYLMPGIPKGKPKVLTTELINEIYENPNTNSLTDYFIEINIIDIACKSDRDYKFGLLWKQNEKGSKLYGNECVSNRVISKTELLDLLEFYDCSYEIIRGYYFDEGYNTLIKEFIKKLFDLRASYKKQGNPLEKTVKLLLNSIYGKSILKPIDCETKCIHENRLEKFIYRHYNYIKSMEQSENSSNVYIKYIKSINRHFNFPQFGVNVLAYSKHLMNTVMCTAEQANIDIYYQDTDSIHIKEEDLPLLADRFNEKYNRELIGSNLGQFHSDFDSIASSDQIKEAASQGIKYQVWSKKLIALGKKSYLDILEDNLGNIGYHARMKGVPNQCLTIKCQELGITLEELYMNLYNGNEVEFDLLKGCAGFKLTNTFEQYTRDNFSRKLRF